MSSYSSGISAVPLLGDTIGGNLDATVARFPEREALVDRPSGRRWTYAQLSDDVTAVALGLLALGVGTGDRVGIWAPNCPEWARQRRSGLLMPGGLVCDLVSGLTLAGGG